MQTLSLNFFGEKIEINVPSSLSALRENIVNNFLFDPKDVAELLVTYTKDLKRFIIKTEEDFKNFLNNKIFNIDLDIDEKSCIFQKNLDEIQKNQELLKKLESERKKIIDDNNKEIIKGKDKIKEIKKKINEYQKEIEAENVKLLKIHKNNVQLLKAKEMEINELRKKLSLEPIKTNEEKKALKKVVKKPVAKHPKKIEKKVKKTVTKEEKVETKPEINNFFKNILELIPQVQEIFKNKINVNNEPPKVENKTEKIPTHYCIRCDGCRAFPIRGIRYKCAVCNDFDYCEACEEKFKEIHKHPFIKITRPEYAPKNIEIIIPQNMPEFKK